MSSISHAQYVEMLSRLNPARVQPNAASAVSRESDLHDQIEQFCRDNGWVCVHSRMDKPTRNGEGVTDFIIATDDGRTLWIEAKRKGGKLSPAQHAFVHWLERNRQIVAVVHSMEEFIAVTKMKNP